MAWVVKVCEIADGKRRERSVFTLGEIPTPISIGQVGLSLAQGKAVMAAIQSAIISIQSAALAEHARSATRAETGVVLKDYRLRQIQTVYGSAEFRVPRLEKCGVIEPCISWPSNCRSTPEFHTLRMTLSAWMSYRAECNARYD